MLWEMLMETVGANVEIDSGKSVLEQIRDTIKEGSEADNQLRKMAENAKENEKILTGVS